MLKSKELLNKHLEDLVMSIITDNDICNNVYDYAKLKYEIPKSITSDLICMRTSFMETSDYILFCILDSIENAANINSKLSVFFTDKEISTYSETKYNVEKIEFPIRFKMIQISYDQWIGSISIKTVMKLRAAQLINYNINAQRTMQKIIKNNKEIYKITLNESATKSISALLKANAYIPTPLTLNIPQESDADFFYDNEKCELVIKKLPYFDITDGYHRYIAACKISDSDKNFDYKMELRIINFSEEKARQFIYQEDQKTKMKKVDSNSFNINNPGNIVAERMNQSSQCNLQGLIGRNSEIINLGELAGLINYFYFKNTNKDKEKILIISTTKELIEKFNLLTEYDNSYLEDKYSFKTLSIIMFIFANYEKKYNNINMCELINNCISKADLLDNKRFYAKTPKKSAMNEIENLIKESDKNV